MILCHDMAREKNPTSYPPIIEAIIKQMTTHIFHNEFGERIGEVKDNAVYMKRVTESEHLFRKADAWAISNWVLTKLESVGVNIIVIYENEHNIFYVSSVSMFRTYGVKINYEDAQTCLPRNYFYKLRAYKDTSPYNYIRAAIDHRALCNCPAQMPFIKINRVDRCIHCLRDVTKDKKFMDGKILKRSTFTRKRKIT